MTTVRPSTGGGRLLELVPRGDGTYELCPAGGAARSSRPVIPGASPSRGPGSPVTGCPLGTISVTVVRDDDGRPVEGVKITVGGIETKTTDGLTGKVGFEKVPPDTYLVTARLPAGTTPAFAEPDEARVTLEPSSTSSLTIRLEPLSTLEVAVRRAADRSAVDGVEVAIAFGGRVPGAVFRALTGPTGIARFERIPGGSYSVDVTLGSDLGKLFRPPAPLSEVEVDRGAVKGNVEILLAPLPWVAIKLVDETGAAIGRFRVALEGGGTVATADGQAGEARFERLPADVERYSIASITEVDDGWEFVKASAG